MKPFQALVVDRQNEQHGLEIRTMGVEELPDGELYIQVVYSSLNYKDALACSPDGKIIRSFPFIPGIDLAGIVRNSADERFKEGDQVLVTGYETGVTRFGGLSQFARVPSAWAVPLPSGLTMKEAMIIGTAGFTAACSVDALLNLGLTPDKGPILVTGATGGVGSLSVAILSKLGFDVAAVTGKPDMEKELQRFGASRVIAREELRPEKPRPLDKQLWAGAVDCVGGDTLAYILSTLKYGGAVAASGLTGGSELSTTVFPFILRGVSLLGIDSVYVPMDRRLKLWDLLSKDWKPSNLEGMGSEITLEQVPNAAEEMLRGGSKGRKVVRTDASWNG